MADPLPICPIPSNSDIAGIGVRIATYLQACLVSLLATVAMFSLILPESKPSRSSRIWQAMKNPSEIFKALASTIEAMESGLYATSFSVLIGAMIQAKSVEGLTSYHALVILNLAQINNYTAFSLSMFHFQRSIILVKRDSPHFKQDMEANGVPANPTGSKQIMERDKLPAP